MRIAIPTDDNTSLAGHTGRARGLAIFDVHEGTATLKEIRPNTFTAHGHHGHAGEECGHGSHGHGAPHSHDGLIGALDDCNAMIARGMGPRLVNDLERCGIQVIFTAETDLQSAANRFVEGNLTSDPRSSTCHRT
ncbi:hypothetical protein KKH27_09645 [bacterium]|nr:hypothetical protein [bacterium]MBU1983758.1 hypothetical protein [bacterium]